MKELFLSVLTGNGAVVPLIAFALAGALEYFVASKLAHYADIVAEASGLGRLFIGSLLLAGSTSMPEIVTDINAAAFSLPDIGVGDLLGSTLANMFILALLIFAYEKRRILQSVALDHALVGALAIELTAIAGLSIAVGGFGSVLGIGIDALIVVAIYALGMRVVFDLTRTHAAAEETKASPAERRRQLRGALFGFGATTFGLVLIVPLLVFSAEALSHETGLSEGFVGTVLVGFTTSFPEMAAAVAAVRLGAVDLAVGNIFGSNAFNMTILLLMDIAYRGDPVLASVSDSHTISAGAGVVAVALGVMAILARTHSKLWVSRVLAGLIVATYGGGVYLLATHS
jgi:cation:H+ antiporter